MDGLHLSSWLSFLKALALVESGGNPEAIGDGGDSWGKYQLQSAYVQDASEWGLSNGVIGKPFKHSDAFNPERAELIIYCYMKRYATPQRLGRQPTIEDWARLHVGGPQGHRKRATQPHWNKMKKLLATLGFFNSSNN